MRVKIQSWRGRKILSKRQPPQELLVLQRLLVRLPQNHKKIKQVMDKIYQLNAGYSGEVETDQILPEIGIHNDFSIIKGLRIEVLPNIYVQIDTLLITRKCMILLEVKKYAGTVEFDEASGKTIKTSLNGEIDKYDCVVHQVDRAVHGLKLILGETLHPTIPLLPIIVMANQNVEIAKYPVAMPVKYRKQLPRYIREILQRKDLISQQEAVNIFNFLNSCHTARKHIPACEQYEISPSELLKGVLCPRCDHVMNRKQGKTWTCESCLTISREAVEQAVLDWFYLVSPTITNRQLRYFLEVDSKFSASKILRQLQLPKTGASSNTVYMWNPQS